MKAMKQKTKKREHRWSGAGYVCADCGAIKNTSEIGVECPGTGKTGFDVWLYHAGGGWWLDEEEVESAKKASVVLARKIGTENVVGGAIIPAGQPLGFFNRERGYKR